MSDPLTVPCTDCLAPADTDCRHNSLDYVGTFHQERHRLADLRSLERGTCALCSAFMVKGTVLGSPVDAWHPDENDAAKCPDLPNPATDWNGYATMVNLGATPGHPGIEHFQPNVDPAASCPECRQGKCGNCCFTIPVGDTVEVLPCACGTAGHPPLAVKVQ